jgi:hypothetical protein
MAPLSNSWARRRFALCFVQGGQLSAAAAGLVEHLAGMAGRPR